MLLIGYTVKPHVLRSFALERSPTTQLFSTVFRILEEDSVRGAPDHGKRVEKSSAQFRLRSSAFLTQVKRKLELTQAFLTHLLVRKSDLSQDLT